MSDSKYAGFWLRFVAYLIDGFIIGTVQSFIIVPMLAMFGLGIATMDGMSNMEQMPEENIIAIVFGAISAMSAIILVAGIISLIYYTIMESSKYQATLGKMALGLKVTDMDGKRLDFGRSLLRNLGKIISQMVLMIGYIMAGLTAKKQALHDMIAGALVVKK